MKVDEIQPKSIVSVKVIILRKYPMRLVKLKTLTTYAQATACKDETGTIGVVLWGDNLNTFKVGDYIHIKNAWCDIKDGVKVISAGRQGQIIRGGFN